MIEPDEDNSTDFLAFKQRFVPLPMHASFFDLLTVHVHSVT